MPENFRNVLPGLVDLAKDPSYVPPAQIPTQALDRHDGYRHPRPARAAASLSPATEVAQHDSATEAGRGSFSGRLNPSDLVAAGIAQSMTSQPVPATTETNFVNSGVDQPTVRLNIGKMSIGLPSGRAATDTIPLPKLATTEAETYGRHALIRSRSFTPESAFDWFGPANKP